MSGIEEVNFQPGTVVFKEGDKADSVYFVLSGGVEVSKEEHGTKITLAKLGANAVFGEMALIDNKPRSASVVTNSPTQCMKGTQVAFNMILSKTDPSVRDALHKIVTLVREKNSAKKAQMSQDDIAMLTSLNQKSIELQKQIMSSAALQANLTSTDPFVLGVYQSLLKTMVS